MGGTEEERYGRGEESGEESSGEESGSGSESGGESQANQDLLDELSEQDPVAYEQLKERLDARRVFSRKQQDRRKATRQKFMKSGRGTTINPSQAILKFLGNRTLPQEKRYATAYGYRNPLNKNNSPEIIITFDACTLCDAIVSVSAINNTTNLFNIDQNLGTGITNSFLLTYRPYNDNITRDYIVQATWASGVTTRFTVTIPGANASGNPFATGTNTFTTATGIEDCIAGAAQGSVTQGVNGDYQFSSSSYVSGAGSSDSYYLNLVTPNVTQYLTINNNGLWTSPDPYGPGVDGVVGGISITSDLGTILASDMSIGQNQNWFNTQSQGGANVHAPKSWQLGSGANYVFGPSAVDPLMQGWSAVRVQLTHRSYDILRNLPSQILGAIDHAGLWAALKQATANGTNSFVLGQLSGLAGVSGVANQVITFHNISHLVGYAEKLDDCFRDTRSAEVIEVCLQSNSPSYYLTTSKDCDGNTIDSDYLDGTLQADFIANPGGTCCAVDCSDFHPIASATTATFGTADGSITVDATDYTVGLGNGQGTPFSIGHYTFTLSHPSLTLTQDAPPTGGNTASISCTTNVTAGTAHQVTVGSADDQVATGMRVSGTGIPASSYVGQILAGSIGSDAAGVTQFELVDANGDQVDATGAATVSLSFAPGFVHTWGSLLPTTNVQPYTLQITDDAGCVETILVHVPEADQVFGCTTSSALNYDSTAVVDDGSCAYCNATTGLIEDSTGTSTLDLYSVLTVDTQVATNTSTSDGEFSVQFIVDPLMLALQLTASFTYTITLYKLGVPGDNTSIIGSAVATQASLAAPIHNFTGLAHAYYGAKVVISDGTGSTIEIEECFGWAYDTVKAKACIDPLANNVSTIS